MTYKGPNLSCPHFDNALSEFDNLVDEIKDLVQARCRSHESEIETAREINATLRDDNETLSKRIIDLEEELAEARSQIQALREET